MGRKKVAENSEIAHFRIDINQKRPLEAHGKKIGKKFSDLARIAIGEYIARIQEKDELLDESRIEKIFGAEFLKAYKLILDSMEESRRQHLRSTSFVGAGLGLHKAFEVLEYFIEANQEIFNGFPWKTERETLEKVDPEVEEKMLTTKMAIIRQYLIFQCWISKWWEERKKRLEMEEFSRDFAAQSKLTKAFKNNKKETKEK